MASVLHSASTGHNSQASKRGRGFMAGLEGNTKENIVHFHSLLLKGGWRISRKIL